MKISWEVPEKAIPFFQTRLRHQILYGGRASSKTNCILKKILETALAQTERATHIICAREYQSSIKNSSYAELKQFIYESNLDAHFDIKYDSIICKKNGCRIIFQGLIKNILTIKGIPNIVAIFIEEAEPISRAIWNVLLPTIRKAGAQIFIAFNPIEEQSATYQMFLVEFPEDKCFRLELNYLDNPFLSQDLLDTINWMKDNDYPRYEHIYLGKPILMTEDVIFKGRFKILDVPLDFRRGEYYYNGECVPMLYGMDFGFSTDQAAMPQLCFLDEHTIYIHKEIYELKLLPQNYIPKIKEVFTEGLVQHGWLNHWKADSARPDSIAQLVYDGLDVVGAPKPPGSVESGIQYLLGKNIIINPKCANAIYEFGHYKYKTDKNTGKITRDIIDKDNHLIDAIRYALCEQIAASNQANFNFDKEALESQGIYLS